MGCAFNYNLNKNFQEINNKNRKKNNNAVSVNSFGNLIKFIFYKYF
jgi:hypothetical protein